MYLHYLRGTKMNQEDSCPQRAFDPSRWLMCTKRKKNKLANIRKGPQTEHNRHSEGPPTCREIWGRSSGSFCKNRNHSAL